MSAKKGKQKIYNKNPNFTLFKDIVVGRAAIPNSNEFKNQCGFLYAHAIVSGLTEEEVELLINVLCKCQLRVQSVRALMKCLIPQSALSRKVIDNLMIWLLSKNCCDSKITAVILEWFVGLLENDLMNIDAVDSYYPHFFSMLAYGHYLLAPYLFKLIYKLTKPEDVTCQYVRVLSTLSKNRKYATALLWLFKMYKPHLIHEDIRSVDLDNMLSKIPCQFQPGLHYSQINKQLSHSLSICRFFNDRDRQQNQCHASKLIPTTTYHFGESERIHERSLQEMSKKVKFKIPDRIMALLANDAGYHIITMSNIEEQNRFSILLFSTLKEVFKRNEIRITIEEQSTFLEQILKLEDYMQQGIPVVTNFLINYLNFWDGSYHYYYILQLIKWVTFSSFTDLYQILRPLHMLFVSHDTDMKCEIISALMGLIRNMTTVDLYRASHEWVFPFLKVQPLWLNDPLPTLQNVIRFVENLIQLGLCIDPDSNCLLHQAVSFYEMMSHLEENCDLPLWTILPPGVVYRSFFRVSPVTLNQICRLLLRYKNVTIPLLKSSGQYENFVDKVETVNSYCYDLINCMCLGQVIENRKEGVIFNTMPKEIIQRLTQVVNVNKVFNIQHHIAFSMYNFLHHRVRDNTIPKTIEECFLSVERYTTGVADLIKAYYKNL